jgi:hypothetical protein
VRSRSPSASCRGSVARARRSRGRAYGTARLLTRSPAARRLALSQGRPLAHPLAAPQCVAVLLRWAVGKGHRAPRSSVSEECLLNVLMSCSERKMNERIEKWQHRFLSFLDFDQCDLVTRVPRSERRAARMARPGGAGGRAVPGATARDNQTNFLGSSRPFHSISCPPFAQACLVSREADDEGVPRCNEARAAAALRPAIRFAAASVCAAEGALATALPP